MIKCLCIAITTRTRSDLILKNRIFSRVVAFKFGTIDNGACAVASPSAASSIAASNEGTVIVPRAIGKLL